MVAGLVAFLFGVVLKYDKPSTAPTTPIQELSVSVMQPVNLGPIINTKLREAEASFATDGTTMYFNCEMHQGSSGNDICVSRLIGTLEAGQWSRPEIVAPDVISRTDTLDVEPIISLDEKTLFF